MVDKENIVKAPCRACRQPTWHKILFEVHWRSDQDDYDFGQQHSVIECLGCEERSFRLVTIDYDGAYPAGPEDEWTVPEEVIITPKFDLNHQRLKETYWMPEFVKEIYQESMLAIQEEALTLAGLGLRGTIEAICNECNISGRTLESRISKLAQQGLISTKDADRLHAIRFLGNDAAHEIKKPTAAQISVAVKIINHLIQSIYLLEKEASGALDTIVASMDEFKRLLLKKLQTCAAGDEIPLAKILEKDMRRLSVGAAQLEAQLVTAINDGDFTKLSIGKVAKYGNSKDPVQHFVVKS